jgi:hypothetical protein
MVHHFQPLIVGNRYIWPCVTMQSELSMLVPIHSASFKGPVEKKECLVNMFNARAKKNMRRLYKFGVMAF